jgi:hypothetical protein
MYSRALAEDALCLSIQGARNGALTNIEGPPNSKEPPHADGMRPLFRGLPQGAKRLVGACPKARSAWQVPLGSPRLRVSEYCNEPNYSRVREFNFSRFSREQ